MFIRTFKIYRCDGQDNGENKKYQMEATTELLLLKK